MEQFSSHSISIKRLEIVLLEHFQVERNLMVRKLSHKYDFEQTEKSLSQAKYPISWTPRSFNINLYFNVDWSNFPDILTFNKSSLLVISAKRIAMKSK